MTRNGKMLTAKGVKPVCPYLQAFENTWLFGSFSPITGNSVVMEMPECNSDCFQIFLTDVSKNKPDELKIIILDRNIHLERTNFFSIFSTDSIVSNHPANEVIKNCIHVVTPVVPIMIFIKITLKMLS